MHVRIRPRWDLLSAVKGSHRLIKLFKHINTTLGGNTVSVSCKRALLLVIDKSVHADNSMSS